MHSSKVKKIHLYVSRQFKLNIKSYSIILWNDKNVPERYILASYVCVYVYVTERYILKS